MERVGSVVRYDISDGSDNSRDLDVICATCMVLAIGLAEDTQQSVLASVLLIYRSALWNGQSKKVQRRALKKSGTCRISSAYLVVRNNKPPIPVFRHAQS